MNTESARWGNTVFLDFRPRGNDEIGCCCETEAKRSETNMRKLLIVAVALVPISCDAAAPPKALLKPVVKAVAKPAIKAAAKPVVAATRPAAPIGVFKLDRAPEQGGLARGWVPTGTIRLVADGQDVAIAPDGRFVVGFGRDYKATVLLTAFQSDGGTISEKSAVAPRAWKIERLDTLPHHSQPDAEFQARRPAELAQINAARHRSSTSDGWRQTFVWPASGRISGVFGSQRIYAGEPGAPHSGVDVAGPVGAPVIAPADGVVILAAASPFTLEGNLLMIDHGMGLNSAFLHLSRIDVKLGDVVKQGQRVGAIGQTGRATGPHLHWGMKWQDERLDPQRLPGGQ
jgi:murein DD-endopeptidase MepM/ murein hydrolase activator NlpD